MTADELLDWRKTSRLFQSKASELIGCSVRGLQKWEYGENAIPKSIALAIAAVQFD